MRIDVHLFDQYIREYTATGIYLSAVYCAAGVTTALIRRSYEPAAFSFTTISIAFALACALTVPLTTVLLSVVFTDGWVDEVRFVSRIWLVVIRGSHLSFYALLLSKLVELSVNFVILRSKCGSKVETNDTYHRRMKRRYLKAFFSCFYIGLPSFGLYHLQLDVLDTLALVQMLPGLVLYLVLLPMGMGVSLTSNIRKLKDSMASMLGRPSTGPGRAATARQPADQSLPLTIQQSIRQLSEERQWEPQESKEQQQLDQRAKVRHRSSLSMSATPPRPPRRTSGMGSPLHRHMDKEVRLLQDIASAHSGLRRRRSSSASSINTSPQLRPENAPDSIPSFSLLGSQSCQPTKGAQRRRVVHVNRRSKLLASASQPLAGSKLSQPASKLPMPMERMKSSKRIFNDVLTSVVESIASSTSRGQKWNRLEAGLSVDSPQSAKVANSDDCSDDAGESQVQNKRSRVREREPSSQTKALNRTREVAHAIATELLAVEPRARKLKKPNETDRLPVQQPSQNWLDIAWSTRGKRAVAGGIDAVLTIVTEWSSQSREEAAEAKKRVEESGKRAVSFAVKLTNAFTAATLICVILSMAFIIVERACFRIYYAFADGEAFLSGIQSTNTGGTAWRPWGESHEFSDVDVTTIFTARPTFVVYSTPPPSAANEDSLPPGELPSHWTSFIFDFRPFYQALFGLSLEAAGRVIAGVEIGTMAAFLWFTFQGMKSSGALDAFFSSSIEKRGAARMSFTESVALMLLLILTFAFPAALWLLGTASLDVMLVIGPHYADISAMRSNTFLMGYICFFLLVLCTTILHLVKEFLSYCRNLCCGSRPKAKNALD